MGRIYGRAGKVECAQSSSSESEVVHVQNLRTQLTGFCQRLMSSNTIEDLTSCILDFQANIIRVTYRKKTTFVDPETVPSHGVALDFIWNSSKLNENSVDEHGQVLKWRKLGFDSEDVINEFGDVGVLGLDCLVCISGIVSVFHLLIIWLHIQKKFVENDPNFPKVRIQRSNRIHCLLKCSPLQVVLEQLSRPEERRCPIAKASNEVVELLSEHWAIFAPGCMCIATVFVSSRLTLQVDSTSTTFQPFFLDFYKVHSLATHFFLRMWSESGAAFGDFTRVVALVRSQ